MLYCTIMQRKKAVNPPFNKHKMLSRGLEQKSSLYNKCKKRKSSRKTGLIESNLDPPFRQQSVFCDRKHPVPANSGTHRR